MKHSKLLLLPIIGAMMLASCEKQPVNFFSDEKFNAYCVKNFDIDGNGEISEDEAKAVKKIDCSNRGLTSLADIKYFTNLESLNCSGNDLRTLDVSKNTSLTSLIISDNNSLITLLYIDGLTISGLRVGVYVDAGYDKKGVIFSISETATKIMSTDETKADYGCYGITTGAKDDDDGVANTNKIAESSPAAKWCRAKESAWYLPACNELKEIYKNMATLNSTLDSIGGTTLTDEYYWSSTESDNDYAYKINFSNGSTYFNNKNDSYRVRAVRAL